MELADNAELQEAANDPTQFHIVGDINRIGVNLFMIKLEYTHYPPRSGKNHLFTFRILKWPQDEFAMHWVICSIPIEDRELAEGLLEECGLKLADGVPMMLGQDQHVFPMNSKRVFTLENTAGHPIYNDPQAAEELRAKQEKEIEDILEQDNEKIRQELRDKGLNEAQVQRVLYQWQNGNENYMEDPQ